MNRTASGVSVACIAFVLTAGLAAAQATAPPPDRSQPANTEEAVKAANQRLLEAARADDKTTARRMMAEEMSWVNGRGAIQRREDMIGAKPNPPREVIVDRVKMLGTTAVVTGSARFDTGEKVRFLQQWVNRDGEWRLYAHQATALSPAPTGAAAGTPAVGTAGRAPIRSTPPALRSEEERAIWQAQTDLHRAYVSGDVETYSRLTADEFFRMEVTGEERTKSEMAQEVGANARQQGGRIETGDVQIAVTGDSARVVMTSQRTTPDGQVQPANRVTRVFVKRNGQWQQAAAVFTPLAQQ